MPYGYGGYGFVYVLAAQVLFFLVTLGLVYWLVRSTMRKSPEEILKERLARGEISVKEYAKLAGEIMKGKNL